MSGEVNDRYQSDHIGIVQTEEMHRPEPPHTRTSTPKIEALSAESLSTTDLRTPPNTPFSSTPEGSTDTNTSRDDNGMLVAIEDLDLCFDGSS
ncbi:hypothetical protein N7499_000633 [Penicillium canescens]|uniref:Uncharacterized protein n=1 Tax=Penicillium canescens TaxID=5083 RepID=A0AAD6IJ01_PENCN|nr:uncharacterized protein N7446_011167 [Penicillium canescens]KAJ6029485.1 hypothetical protein N7444_012472 [Penicillium canescens]KAJ6047917.1 hypothetical protein N7460_004064 [Penicillium canescens]KAJ6048484.1 hypothetical protein N7446_011167 [Penicillium canescens]KAJ6101003.1 hypothetical protein N7499_000633 [Penicillium canescens]KAJ6173460.1 hypothetical protein N7485_006272 [Penicillium canescens]